MFSVATECSSTVTCSYRQNRWKRSTLTCQIRVCEWCNDGRSVLLYWYRPCNSTLNWIGRYRRYNESSCLYSRRSQSYQVQSLVHEFWINEKDLLVQISSGSLIVFRDGSIYILIGKDLRFKESDIVFCLSKLGSNTLSREFLKSYKSCKVWWSPWTERSSVTTEPQRTS